MESETRRKLASIQRIISVEDIPGADAIQLYTVLGWKVVDKKGAHKVGDLVCYCEIDSWIPHELAPFLSKGQEPRTYNGVKGERLRTIKLRGQVSQGLLLPLINTPHETLKEGMYLRVQRDNRSPFTVNVDNLTVEKYVSLGDKVNRNCNILVHEGDDVTELLGIQKWEAPIPAQLQGQAAGMFPTALIPKTDQERIQGCFGEIQKRSKRFVTEKVWNADTQTLEEQPAEVPADFKEPTYEVTLKLDGSSMTLFRWEGQLRVCSRNLELKINDENADNTFVAMALKYADSIPEGFAFQGEIWGESIQGNKEGIKGQRFSVFDIFDIQKHEYLSPAERRNLCAAIGIDHAPVLGVDWKAPESIEDGLKLASGPSIHAKHREGIVWKCNEDPNFSFKIISNEWLLKHGE
jgi:RNA ligase (TIGR02306 family)